MHIMVTMQPLAWLKTTIMQLASAKLTRDIGLGEGDRV